MVEKKFKVLKAMEDMKMNHKSSEQERKELNQKLIKQTFVSEIKSRKKEKLVKFVIEFVCLFIAFVVSDLIVTILQIDFWALDMAISIVFVMVMLYVSKILTNKFTN